MKFLIFLAVAPVFIFLSCNQHGDARQIPQDSAIAAHLLDLQTYKPLNVIAKYDGPNVALLKKDSTQKYKLEALLYYDEYNVGEILSKFMDADFPKANYSKEDFEFNWLDDDLKMEIESGDPKYTGSPDIFLGTNGKAKIWFVGRKVLVKLEN